MAGRAAMAILCALACAGAAAASRPAPLAQSGGKLTGAGESGPGGFGWRVALSTDGRTALVGGTNDNRRAGAAWVFVRSGRRWVQQGPKLTAPTSRPVGFGDSVALSADGSTALVGGPAFSGLDDVWVFSRRGGRWAETARLAPADGSFVPGTTGGYIDSSVALSADGSTALVGGQDDGADVGAAWVFRRSGSVWTQQGPKLLASDEAGPADFGDSVALSSDGATALIGGLLDHDGAGAAWFFSRTAAGWVQRGPKLVGRGEIGSGLFGSDVALSADGRTALIGGFDDNQTAGAEFAGLGAAWVFTPSGAGWAQQGPKLTARGETVRGELGDSVALSADGDTALVGGLNDDHGHGAAWVFNRSRGVWRQQPGKLTPRDAKGAAGFGWSVALSSRAATALIGGATDDRERGAAWVFTNGSESSPAGPAVRIRHVGDGTVRVSWARDRIPARSHVTGYLVRAQRVGSDLVPAPPAPRRPAHRRVGAGTHGASLHGLLEDCHQRYRVTVRAESAHGAGRPVASAVFRPSGIVRRGKAPPYVVVLLDGVGEFKPGFTMDPYAPSNVGHLASYCPENVDRTGRPVKNDFPHEPQGPWEFFRKWNYYDPSDTAGGNDPVRASNSTPRVVVSARPAARGARLVSGEETHRFMLDEIAGRGAIVLPFSYQGAGLVRRGAGLRFVFNAYTACNSTPGEAGFGCDHDPGGAPDPRANASEDFSIGRDEQTLATEVRSIRAIWNRTKIIVVGHSQGGLIAYAAWRDGLLHAVDHLFSLDSPINGVCPLRVKGQCVGPPGYPRYDSRVALDAPVLQAERRLGNPFSFVGTNGDSVAIVFDIPGTKTPIVNVPAYGTGNETLQHQLMVRAGRCISAGQGNDAGCPEAPHGPDHITDGCPIPARGWVKDDQHFIVKFCPGNVRFFNSVLGLDEPHAR